ncbi:hypothetical protein H359_0830 [Chlamydia ibidis 10-1398/6]|uniref:Uncharacterized protein n=1 Tax=Chlamydia ibidis 10-1398/6 TaxID=1046581 RepID=A0ABP2XDE7_9CHLA|nr:hypothetical protein H359_0830 [Chlamydia ibidis 10-1398/6]
MGRESSDMQQEEELAVSDAEVVRTISPEAVFIIPEDCV